MKQLNCLPVGSAGRVARIDGDNALTRRLAALGCLPGTVLKVVRKAPMGDPLIIKFRGFSLAIRKQDAGYIFLEA